MGPVAGAAIELIKILLNFAINGTITAGVGELANFLLGCSFVVPAGIIYRKMHTRKGAIIGMATGTVLMTIFGCFLNAFVLLPAYGKAFGMPMEALVWELQSMLILPACLPLWHLQSHHLIS